MYIDWADFKRWKQIRVNQGIERENLSFLASYVKARLNTFIDEDIFSVIKNDSLGRQMLEKNSISEVNSFSFYMSNNKYVG